MMSAACLPKSPSWSMMLAKILIRMLMMMSSTRIHWSSSSRQPQARGQEWLSIVKAVIRGKRQCYWDQGCLNLDWRSSWSSTVFPASCARNTGSTFFFNMMQFESREVVSQGWPASGWKAFCLSQNALKWWGLYLRPAHWRQTESSVTLLIKNPCGDNLQLLHTVRIAVWGTAAMSASFVAILFLTDT